MSSPMVVVGLSGAWLTALIGPFADDAGSFQHDELASDDTGSGINAAIRGSECENRGGDVRWRCLCLRVPVSLMENVDSKDRNDATKLLKEGLDIGLLSL